MWKAFLRWLKKLWKPEAEVEAPLVEPTPEPVALLDELNPSLVTWDEPAGDVGAWPVTASIIDGKLTKDGMEASYVGTDAWPARRDSGTNPAPTIGNWWLIAYCPDGKWHGATIEWLGRGKTRVTGKRWDGTDDIHGMIGLHLARPSKGTASYIMISGCARAGAETVKERSQTKKVVWP